MNIENIKYAYSENSVVKEICDVLATRVRNQTETKLNVISRHLENKGNDFKKSEIIEAFRVLEAAECGKYIEGRHGHKSRFAWGMDTLQLAEINNIGNTILSEQTDDVQQGFVDDEFIEHQFVLRPDLTISIDLPPDLTQQESIRLAKFMESLSFEE
jgi:hypothetical protein